LPKVDLKYKVLIGFNIFFLMKIEGFFLLKHFSGPFIWAIQKIPKDNLAAKSMSQIMGQIEKSWDAVNAPSKLFV
jgi:hypothetical protein